MLDLTRERAFATLNRYASKDIVPQVAAEGIANDVIAVLPYIDAWATGRDYAANDTVLWPVEGVVQPVTCITVHSTATHPDWTPDSAPALWRPWHATSPEYALPYLMRHAEDRYMRGEYMLWGAEDAPVTTWRCLEDNTVWTPVERPEAWEKWPVVIVEPEVPEEGETGSDEDEPITDAYPAWEPWDHVRPLYQVGDRVTHQGSAWVSTEPNNHWEPGTFGWEVVAP